jgi:peroxiredoxin
MTENTGNYSGRLQELQEKFRNLEPDIKDSEVKKALSLINGMVQEIWRNMGSGSEKSQRKISLRDVAEMYRNAPKMSDPAINTPLAEGTTAPDFSLKDANGQLVSLSDFRGSNVLLAFYPLDWSPGCSQQLDIYQNDLAEFEKRGIKIIGISVDSIYSHGAWAVVRDLHFPLLSDFNPKGETAKKYHVFRDKDGFTERALYIIDAEGIIRYSYVSPFLHHIPDIYELYKKLDQIQKSVTV